MTWRLALQLKQTGYLLVNFGPSIPIQPGNILEFYEPPKKYPLRDPRHQARGMQLARAFYCQ